MALNQLRLSLQFGRNLFDGDRDPLARHRAVLTRSHVTRWIRHALALDAEITVRIVGDDEGRQLDGDQHAVGDVGAALLILLDRKFELRWGKLFGLYLVIYSTGRLWVEAIRIDPSDFILGLRTNSWSALFGIALGLAIFFVQKRRHPGLETSVSTGSKASEQTSDEVDSKLS